MKKKFPKDKVLPRKDFWAAFVRKAISFTISLKMIILLGATTLLLTEYISESIWRDVIVAIALGRVIVQGVYEYRNGTTKKQVDDNMMLSE